MQDAQPVADSTPLPLRNDTILGVCEALGNDFGFHPNWLRVIFAGIFYLSPVGISLVYLGLGAVVALTRWAYPAKATATATPVPALEVAATQPATHRESHEAERLAA